MRKRGLILSAIHSLGCNSDRSVVSWNRQNYTSDSADGPCSQGDDNMATKINRVVSINGERRWIHANSEQEYANKLEELFRSTKTEKHNFKEYALNWFELYSKPNIDQTTSITYKRQLDTHLFPVFGDRAIEDITTDDLQRFFNQMPGIKATKEKTRMVLNMVLESALEDGIISRNPLKSKRLKITGASSTPTKEYTVAQMQFLVKKLPEIIKPMDQRYLALQALHPLRLEEVLGLMWEDIDLENMVIHVRRAVTHPNRNQPIIKDTKTESSYRSIGLSAIAAEYLAGSEIQNGFVIGGEKPLSYQQVKRMCERIQKDTGFEERITPIRFRTTVLTDIYDQTRDVKITQMAAGHTNASTTMKHYIKGRSGESKSVRAIDSIYGSV